MSVRFELFHGIGKPWRELCQEAADFANQVGRERLISIAQSEDQDDAFITVWYWEEEPTHGRGSAGQGDASPPDHGPRPP